MNLDEFLKENPDTLGCLTQKYLRFYWKAFPSPVHVLWKWDKNTDMTKYRLLSASSSSSCVLTWGPNGAGNRIPPNGQTTHYHTPSPGVFLVLILCLTNSTLTAQHGFIDFFFFPQTGPHASICWWDDELFKRDDLFKIASLKRHICLITKFTPNDCL